MYKELFNKNKYRLIICCSLTLITIFMKIFPLDIFGDIIDGLSNKSISINEIKLKAIYMILLAVSFYLINGFKEVITFRGYYLNQNFFQKKILEKVLKQNPNFFNKLTIGEIMGRLTSDVDEYIAPFFGWGFYTFVTGVIETIIIFIFVSYKIGLEFSILINLPFLIYTLLVVFQNTKIEKDYQNMNKYYDLISEKTLENIKGIRIVRAYNLIDKLKNIYIENVKKYSKHNLKFTLNFVLAHSLNILAVGISYFVLIYVGYLKYSQGLITFGGLISISLIMTMMAWPYTMLATFITNIFDLKRGLNRVNEILNCEDEVVNNGNINFSFNEKIEFKNFSFSYTDRKILKKINLVIKKGETLGIVGKIGSGKTTLVKQLLRLYKNKNIYIDNVEIKDIEIETLRNNIGYVPQEYFIFSQSIKENILFHRNLEENLEQSLYVSDFLKDIETFKDGLDTVVGENGVSLSGGQKQRLSIARALISNPEIIIFDDSLSALDTNTEKNIIYRLKEYRKNKTNIIVSHRISSIIHADKIIILNDGTIEEIGNHEELLLKSKWYKELFDYQNRKGEENE